MYYIINKERSLHIPAPFKRTITPMFMGDDDKIMASDFSIHITEWEPGCEVDMHSHSCSVEAMYCISGHGTAIINGKEYDLIPDSMIVAQPNVEHKITNVSDCMLRVLCVFSPPATEQSLSERAMMAVKAKND